jgi:hypothetical protein
VLLGAGFSRALYGPCPLTDELGEQVRERLPEDVANKLPTAQFIDGRFEEWLSYLSEPQPHFTPEEQADAHGLSLRVTKAISEVLAEIQISALEAGQPDRWFWQFLSVLQVLKAQAITLNYDNFIESGVQTLGLEYKGQLGPNILCEDDILAGLPPCADFPRLNEQTGQGTAYSNNPLNAEDRRNTFKLLKLHGSLSWYWLPEGGGNSTLRRWQLPGTFGQIWDSDVNLRRQELPAHEVFVVPPASLKGQRLREPVMKELWRRAAEVVSSADRIVLIGYSIPPADHSIMGLLSDGIQGRGVKLEIVNPAPGVVEHRLVRLGARSDLIECFCGKDCIADWTATEVDRLAHETLRALRADESLEGEVLMFSTGPHKERFRRLEPPPDASGALVLHPDEPPDQLANARMFAELRPLLDGCSTCAVGVKDQRLPVIDYWVRDRGTGVMMTQLHLVMAGR